MTVQEYQHTRYQQHMTLVYEVQPWRRPVDSDPDWVAALRERIYIRDGGTHVWPALNAAVDGRKPLPPLPTKYAGCLRHAPIGSKFGWLLEGDKTTEFLFDLINEYGFVMGDAVEHL